MNAKHVNGMTYFDLAVNCTVIRYSRVGLQRILVCDSFSIRSTFAMHSHIVLQHGKDSQSLTSMELRSNTQRSRISELEGSLEMAQENTHALRKQTLLLQEKMSNASRELEEKNNECLQLASKVASTDNKLYEAERRVEALATLQSHRWMEFSKMADNMKDLSQNMLAQSKSNTRKAAIRADLDEELEM